MPAPKDILSGAKKGWWRLAQNATWILGVIGSFVLPLPFMEAGGWLKFTKFLVAVLVGLMLVLTEKWKAKKHTWVWFWVTLGLLVCATGAFITYQLALDQWAVRYNAKQTVIGSEATMAADARQWQEEHHETLEQLIMDYAGATEKIWSRDELRLRRFQIAALYVGSAALFSVMLISLLQSLRCRAVTR